MFGKCRAVFAGVALLVCLGTMSAGGAAAPFPGAGDVPEDRWAAPPEAFAQDFGGERSWRGHADDAERPGADQRRFGHRKPRPGDRESAFPRWEIDRRAPGKEHGFQREREHHRMERPEPSRLKQEPAPEIKNIVQPVQGTPKAVVTIPDPGLEAALRQALNKPTGDLTDTDLAGIIFLSARGRSIQNLTGLEYCVNLMGLDLDKNRITSLTGLPALSKLWSLDLSDNQLASLAGLENVPNLQTLDVGGNQLTSLARLEKTPYLRTLCIDGIQLTSLAELPGLPSLQNLYADTNQLTSLTGLENIPNLRELRVRNNRLSSLAGLENVPDLSRLDASGNRITSLAGLENVPNLQTLDVGGNHLASLTGLENTPILTSLSVYNNQLLSLADLSSLPNLYSLYASNNFLASLAGLENVPKLYELDLSQNHLTSLAGLGNATNLQLLDVPNNQLSTLAGLENVPHLRNLNVGRNRLTSLAGLENVPNLQTLFVSNNQLTSLSGLENVPKLLHLSVSANRITSLSGLENVPNLWGLYLSDNELTSLEGLSSATNPQNLFVDGNRLTSLAGLENATELQFLYVRNNQLTSLAGLGSSPNLTSLSVSNNQLLSLTELPVLPNNMWSFDVSRNRLTHIQGLPTGSVENLFLNDNQIADFSPLAGRLPGRYLRIDGNPSGNVEPLLAGLPSTLRGLGVTANQVASATFLNAWKASLENLHISGLMADMGVLSGFGKLEILTLDSCGLASLDLVAPLEGLRFFAAPNNPLTSLEPLRNLSRLSMLDVSGSTITDLSPLPLSKEWFFLDLRDTAVSDISPLKEEMFVEERRALDFPYLFSGGPAVFDFWPRCRVLTPMINLTGTPAATAPEVASLRAAGINVVTDGDPCIGPETTVTVPDVTGLTQAAAQAAITGAGLAVGALTRQCSGTVPAGSVTGQNPVPGALVGTGSAVDLTVSSGPCPETVVVPNVEGLTQSAAQAAITGAGLAVGAVTESFSDTMPSGSVISQDPSAGTQASPGSAVALVVSQGADPASVATARAALAASFKDADTDGDGYLSFAEAQAALPSLTHLVFNALDSDGDGLLSAEELGIGADGCGCGCKKSDMSLDGLKARLGDLFLGALALVLLAGAGRTRK